MESMLYGQAWDELSGEEKFKESLALGYLVVAALMFYVRAWGFVSGNGIGDFLVFGWFTTTVRAVLWPADLLLSWLIF